MLPADQGLDLGDASGLQDDDRLVVHAQLAAPDRVAQVVLQVQPRQAVGLHAGLEQDVMCPPARLGAVHGDIGVAQESIRPFVAGAAERDADARGGDEIPAVDPERAPELLLDAFGRRQRLVLRGDPEQHHELVAAQARDGVFLAHAGQQARGRFPQQLVAGLVPEAVIDELEVVEVEVQEPDLALATGGAHQRLLEPVAKQSPIRQRRSASRGMPAG